MMAGILGIDYVLPLNELSNDELAEEFGTWTAEKIFSKTGIRSRHIAEVDETAVDLGTKAANKLLDSGMVNREDIDFIILVTQTPDYILPNSACIIQDNLGLPRSVGAIDINLGCSGFVYGLAVAKGLIDSGVAGNILLITADTYSKHINKHDKSTRTIFGDGAAATLVGNGGIKIGGFDFGTDGSGKDMLKIPAGGAKLRTTPKTGIEVETDGNIRSGNNLYMDGAGIFEFTIREVPQSVNRLISKEQIKFDDIDMFVFHQANAYMLNFLKKTMKIDDSKLYIDMEDTGNTVSSSIPIALKRAIDKKLLSGKKRIVISGFGVGLSWGTTILYMEG